MLFRHRSPARGRGTPGASALLGTSLALSALSGLAQTVPPAVPQPPAATTAAAPAWKPFQELAFLAGSWSGAAESGGRIGGRVARFTMEMNGQYLVHRGSAVFPGEGGKPDESIEQVGYFSYDREKRRYVATYFFSTGVAGTYDVELLPDGIRLMSRELQNFDGATKSRMGMKKAGDELELTMDIAPNGKDYLPYLSSKLAKR